MSLCLRAACLSRGVKSASFTGTTIDQCLPTGQRCILHQPNLTAFSEPPTGGQVVRLRPNMRGRLSIPLTGLLTSGLVVPLGTSPHIRKEPESHQR
jgi:hypothetical protein